MFFAPPTVKSLSRYSEFGIYLQQRHFWIMLGIAMLLHVFIIGIYAMMPRQEVMQIPVHVLNIKLNAGDGGQSIAMPPSMPALPGGMAPSAAADGDKASAVDAGHPLSPASAPPASKSNRPRVYDPHQKPTHYRRSANDATALAASPAEPNLATPKKYIRENELTAANANAEQSNAGGSAGYGSKNGNEIVERYEQKISLWAFNHKTYPEAAKSQGIEGEAVVRIRIDRNGHLLSNEIDTSSGNALIDQAALDMMWASDPFPPVPDDYPEARQEFLMPVTFKLQ